VKFTHVRVIFSIDTTDGSRTDTVTIARAPRTNMIGKQRCRDCCDNNVVLAYGKLTTQVLYWI
jgi:hypothetical protein